jgi:hypothetical protein
MANGVKAIQRNGMQRSAKAEMTWLKAENASCNENKAAKMAFSMKKAAAKAGNLAAASWLAA